MIRNVLPKRSFVSLAAGFILAGVMPSIPAAYADQNHPVLEQWSQAIEARLAHVNPAAPAYTPLVGVGPALKPDMTGERVDRLAAQLTARGLLATGAYHGVYDAAVEKAVHDFQVQEGMGADGVVGDTTAEALDRSPALTAAALQTTIAEMRELAAAGLPEVFVVNIPSQMAYLIRDGQVVMSMRVAVGRPSRPTPVLIDQITDVIVNPTWTAPTTVLAQDKLPSLRRTGHPGIEGATIYIDGQEVDPATVDWTNVTPEHLRIVQSPGNQNALGRFKFNLTNGDSIYLHDTNDHSVFDRQGRALSSGCVRLAEPRRLAEVLLSREGWTTERIDQALEKGRTQYVGLKTPLPVRLVYWQAMVDTSGKAHLYRDIYNHSGQTSVAVTAPTPTPIQVATKSPSVVTARSARVVQVGEVVVRLPTVSQSASREVSQDESSSKLGGLY